jgi:NitT/TauT family transport system permease protein/sulfonate transport system permease protein
VRSAQPRAAGRHARLAAHAFTLFALAVWAIYAQLVEPYVMPSPKAVALRLAEFAVDLNLLGHVLYTIGHIVGAVAISFVIGSAAALLAFYYKPTRLMVHGRLSPFLNSFSGIGWTLLAVVWFGINDFTVVFAISAVLVPFAIINMREGLDGLDADLFEMGESFTRRRFRRFVLIVVPSLYPFIFATLRISFGVAWKVALTAELLGGNTGLGYLLNLARQDFDMPLLLAVIIIIIAFVYSTDRFIFVPVQARLARHHGPG